MSSAVGSFSIDRRGYARFSLGVLLALVIIALWVATGHGAPGGSLWRRLTGHEGVTGGLTTAMRALLDGDFSRGCQLHPAAPWIFGYLIAQLSWRTLVIWRRPAPGSMWTVDLVASLLLFAAAIYVPWVLR